jgi:poly [ADP-ribose] polymerase
VTFWFVVFNRSLTVNSQLFGIVRLERSGEAEKLAKSAGNRASNRKLLWHGSTCAGLVGILNRGLQIRPFVKN